jgi:molybdopterin-guanine dinucleotide biosynthesis protein A
MEADSEALGVVLAGGLGTRLGGEKATVALGGRPLASYPLAALADAGLHTVICAKPGQALPALDVPVLEEPAEPRHPLCGIVAGLRAGEGRPVVAVACDLPFVSARLIEALAAAEEPLAVPRLAGRPQPLLARYEAPLLGELEAALAEEASLVATLESLRPRYLDEDELARFGDPRRLLLNVNSPADLRDAEALLAP